MSANVHAGSLGATLRWRPSARPSPSLQRCRAGSSSDSSGASTSGRTEPQQQVRRHGGANVQKAAIMTVGVAAGAIVGASAVSVLFADPAGAAQSIGDLTPVAPPSRNRPC